MKKKMNEKLVSMTLREATVEELRARKRSETWDEYLLRLSKRQRCGIECLICGAWIETADAHVSPSVLAEMNGWQEVATKGLVKLGYVCPDCGVLK